MSYGYASNSTITASVVPTYATNVVPNSANDSAKMLILKVCETVKKYGYGYEAEVEGILGQVWSTFINNYLPKSPAIKASDPLREQRISHYYRKFQNEYVLTADACAKVKSIIDKCPYFLVIPNRLCVDITGKRAQGLVIEGSFSNHSIEAIFLNKLHILKLDALELSDVRIYGIANFMMNNLAIAHASFYRTSYSAPSYAYQSLSPRQQLEDSGCCQIL